MTTDFFAPIEARIEMNADPARVWRVISDPKEIAKASPQVVYTHVTNAPPVREGTRMLNLNRRGPLVWPTRAKVVTFEPEKRFAFRVKDNFSIWSYTLEPLDGGARTLVIHRRETPQGVSDVSSMLTERVLGGQRSFRAELEAGMGQTLRRLKGAVERLRG